jgi:PTH1 family peptidyl-tRNA hydrolase
MTDKALIVGLGNPGRAYSGNRHNIGFMLIDRLAAANGITLGRLQNKALVGTGYIAGRPVVLAKPQTYMNLSGESVAPLLRFYKIEPADLLVAYDEIDLPLGTLRLRENGSSGGHNGMKSLIRHLGEGFPRLRLGVGRPPGRMPAAAHVLQDFDAIEKATVDTLLDRAIQAVETFLQEGITLSMSRFNGRITVEE